VKVESVKSAATIGSSFRCPLRCAQVPFPRTTFPVNG